jgi:hypothetical protein
MCSESTVVLGVLTELLGRLLEPILRSPTEAPPNIGFDILDTARNAFFATMSAEARPRQPTSSAGAAGHPHHHVERPLLG